MKGVLVLLKSDKTDWPAAQKELGKMDFLKKLKEYNAEKIPASIIKKMKPIIEDFDINAVANASSAAVSLCKWSCAVINYKEVWDKVAPKIEKSKELNEKFSVMQAALQAKLDEVQAVKDKVEALRTNFAELQKKI